MVLMSPSCPSLQAGVLENPGLPVEKMENDRGANGQACKVVGQIGLVESRSKLLISDWNWTVGESICPAGVAKQAPNI